MTEKILIIDFGSQYTQLIARRIREMQVYCEIHPFNNVPALDESIKVVVMSGSPRSVREEGAPRIDLDAIKGKLPLWAYATVRSTSPTSSEVRLRHRPAASMAVRVCR